MQEVAASRNIWAATGPARRAAHLVTQLIYHPHIHYVVAGGVERRRLFWRRVKKAEFFLPEKVLAARFRTRVARRCRRPIRLVRLGPSKVWRIGWVVDCMRWAAANRAQISERVRVQDRVGQPADRARRRSTRDVHLSGQ